MATSAERSSGSWSSGSRTRSSRSWPGTQAGDYQSPPQTHEQAMALVRLLLGRVAGRRWRASVDDADRRRAARGHADRGDGPVSDQPVTIREHIHQALLAAGPVGLTVAALAEAITGPWGANEVQDSVRRLWEVGELARRQDGTFVLSERTARETRDADRELDEAVRRVAERARRASHQTEVRVRRVDPALLRAYCPTCRAEVAPRLDGHCSICGTQTGANIEAPEPPNRAPRRGKPLRKGQPGWGLVCPRCGGPKGLQADMCRDCRNETARRLQPRPQRRRPSGAHHRRAARRSASAICERPQPARGRGRASPAHRLQDSGVVRRGAVRALQAPRLEAPAAARGDRGAQLQARPQAAHADPGAAERLPPLAGRAARVAGRPRTRTAALQGRQAEPSRERTAVPTPRTRRLRVLPLTRPAAGARATSEHGADASSGGQRRETGARASRLNSRCSVENGACLARRMPALPVTLDLSLRGESREHAVQVIGLDLHRLRDLRDGDAGPLTNQLQCLRRARVPATAGRAGARRRAPASSHTGAGGAGSGVPRGGGATGARAGPDRAVHRSGQSVLPQAGIPHRAADEAAHRCPSPCCRQIQARILLG